MILFLICNITITVLWGAISFHRMWADTSESKLKVGERVLVISKYVDSVCITGGHAPFFAEIVRVRRHRNLKKYLYDVIYDDGVIELNIFEHNLDGPTLSTRPSIVHSLDELSKL